MQGADFHNVAFLPVREAFIAVLTTNLPSIFVLLRRWLSPFFSVLRTSKTTRTTGGTGNPTYLQQNRQNSTTPERRATFVDQMFVRPQGPKTEVYSMKRMETFDTTEMNGSQERIFQQAAGGSRDSEEQGDFYNRRHSMSSSQMRVGRPTKKLTRNRSRSHSRTRPASGADDVETHTGYGITKQVEITIVEERAERPGPGLGPGLGPFDESGSQMLNLNPPVRSSVTGPPTGTAALAGSESSMELKR